MSSIIKMVATAALAFGALGLGAAPTLAQDVVTGAAKVIDGDIIQVDKTRVILWAVDPRADPEMQGRRVHVLDTPCWAAVLGNA